MSSLPGPRAWLLMVAGESRMHAGNSGYDDQADSYYTWDSTVPNHMSIRVGDAVALWDRTQLLGVSVIEAIDESVIDKLRFRCPSCDKTNIQERKSKTPKYLCPKCHTEFDHPVTEIKSVTQYRSRHDAAWSDLQGLLDGHELRNLCESPASQHSIRPLDWIRFREAIEQLGGERATERVARRAPDFAFPEGHDGPMVFPQGHSRAWVRVRRGQQRFREHILGSQGELCAFTGPAPARVLEAGHLYSYARLGEQHEHGGLMLRRDIHKLFDDGWLAVDPETLKVDVSTFLTSYPQYWALHGTELGVTLRGTQVMWLEKHWREHRNGEQMSAYKALDPSRKQI